MSRDAYCSKPLVALRQFVIVIATTFAVTTVVPLAATVADDRPGDEAPEPPRDDIDEPVVEAEAPEPQEMAEDVAEETSDEPAHAGEDESMVEPATFDAPAASEPAALAAPDDGASLLVTDSDEPAEPATPPIDAATLAGVQPGVTTRGELYERWGQPIATEKVAGGVREVFAVAGFERVRATISEDRVDALGIQLSKPMPIDVLAKEMKVEDVEAVEIYDDAGWAIGRAYPERGVMLGLVPRSRRPVARQIILQPLDAEPFLARAESRLKTRYTDCRSDLGQALKLAPASSRAHWLQAELGLRTGELAAATQWARKATELAPANLEYRLTLARLLAESGDPAQAARHAQAVIEDPRATPLVLAKAHVLLGDSTAAGTKPDFAKAMELHVQAIKLAEPLAAGKQLAVRRAARDLLVDAHLSVARDIGWGRWSEKSAVLPKWLDKAAALADDEPAKLRVLQQSLAAIAGTSDPSEVGERIRNTTQLGASMLERATDPLYKARLSWQLAVALGDAVEIEAAHEHWEQAQELGRLALECFQQGALAGGESPMRDFVRGRLYFRLGAIAAVEHKDHRAAAAWFDRALPLLEQAPAGAAAVTRARRGEMLVSMGISYWDVNNRDAAVRLTERGAKLMEKAAAEGSLAREALSVPYGNLATMHKRLGHGANARKYSVMAASFQQSTESDRPRPVIIDGTAERLPPTIK